MIKKITNITITNPIALADDFNVRQIQQATASLNFKEYFFQHDLVSSKNANIIYNTVDQ